VSDNPNCRKYDTQEIANREHDDILDLKKVMPYGWSGTAAIALPTDSSGNLKIDPTNLDSRYLKLDQTTPQTVASGAPLFSYGVHLADTTTSTSGVLFKNSMRFLHNFHHPTGSTAIPNGYNVFLGGEAGNFTMGSTATNVTHGSYNIGIGRRTLYVNTTGWGNVAIAPSALTANTIGEGNVAVGYLTLTSNTEGTYNMAIGYASLFSNLTGGSNSAIGGTSLYSLLSGSYNTAVGVNALRGLTTSSYNIGIGYESGRYLSDGSTANTTGSYGTYLGTGTKASADGLTYETVIGAGTIGKGSNTATIGSRTNSNTYLRGSVAIGQGTEVGTHIINSTTRNGGFETAGAGGADVFANWTESKAGTSTINDETVDVYEGSHACRFDVDASNSNANVYQANIVTVGRRYRISLYAKANSGTPTIKIVGLTQYASFTLTTSYAKYTADFTADGNTVNIQRNSAASKSIYIDKVDIREITDYSLTFDGGDNDGVITWYNDDDYFSFADVIALPYLAGAPTTLVNGMCWMESDGLHIYYAGAEKTVAGV